jgi:hypothetical protein
MQELVGNRKFAEAADIQKEIDQLRAECEATVSSVAALEPGLRALSLKEGRTLQLIKSAAHYARSEIAAAEKNRRPRRTRLQTKASKSQMQVTGARAQENHHWAKNRALLPRQCPLLISRKVLAPFTRW